MPGTLERGWRNVICAASGPSFTDAQADIVERARLSGAWRVVAVNTTALTLARSADAMFAADIPWWQFYSARVAAEFPGERWTCTRPLREIQYKPHSTFAGIVSDLGIRMVNMERKPGLSVAADTINSGGNSGYQAIGLACLFGARKITLVGYDMQRTGGRTHHHGDHTGKLHNTVPAAYKDWVGRFALFAPDLLAAGIDVVNCSPETALTCFRRGDLATELETTA